MPDADVDESGGWTKCQVCGEVADEYCQDGACRACHKSVSWEDCTDGTWNARMLLRNGRSRKDILEIYPDARI